MEQVYNDLLMSKVLQGNEYTKHVEEYLWGDFKGKDYSNENLLFDVITTIFSPYMKEKGIKFQLKKLDYIDNLNYFYIKNNIIRSSINNIDIIAIKLNEYENSENQKVRPMRGKNKFENILKLSSKIKKEHKVLIGYVHDFDDEVASLHTWIEVNFNDKDYVVDVYNNTIINKDGFYYMKHPKIINCINNKDLKNDKTFIKELKNLKHFLEIYLSSRNEITKDLQKNLFLFKNVKH